MLLPSDFMGLRRALRCDYPLSRAKSTSSTACGCSGWAPEGAARGFPSRRCIPAPGTERYLRSNLRGGPPDSVRQGDELRRSCRACRTSRPSPPGRLRHACPAGRHDGALAPCRQCAGSNQPPGPSGRGADPANAPRGRGGAVQQCRSDRPRYLRISAGTTRATEGTSLSHLAGR